MGRLAQQFAGLNIVDMIPYNMPSTLVMTSATTSIAFPGTDLLNTVDKPFAVHRMTVRILGLSSGSVIIGSQPALDVIEGLVSFQVKWTGFDMDATKAVVPVGNLLLGTADHRAWSFEEPIVLPNSYGVQILANCGTFPTTFTDASITQLSVRVNLQGYLLVVAPARG